jgi:hypothetical protein
MLAHLISFLKVGKANVCRAIPTLLPHADHGPVDCLKLEVVWPNF